MGWAFTSSTLRTGQTSACNCCAAALLALRRLPLWERLYAQEEVELAVHPHNGANGAANRDLAHQHKANPHDKGDAPHNPELVRHCHSAAGHKSFETLLVEALANKPVVQTLGLLAKQKTVAI